MVVLITDGRANISLARSNEDPDAMGPDAPKPTQVGHGSLQARGPVAAGLLPGALRLHLAP